MRVKGNGRTSERQSSIVVGAGFPASLADTLVRRARSVGVEETATVQRDAEYQFGDVDALSGEISDGSVGRERVRRSIVEKGGLVPGD